VSNKMTPRSDVDLCASCTHSFIREGYSGHRDVFCQLIQPPLCIKEPTVFCKDYRHKNETDLYDLEKIAWIVTTDPKGKMGFRPWIDMTKEERDRLGVRRY
jgi:hypothetical protein